MMKNENKPSLDALSPFVRAYLITALWCSGDEFYFTRKAAQGAGWGVHSETVDGVEKWVHVAPGENGADFVHQFDTEIDAWKTACDAANVCPSENLDAEFGPEDFAPEALARAIADCEKFQKDNAETLAAAIESGEVVCGPDFGPEGRAGHDFWLTRNGHGAGFWDGDWPEKAGRALTDSAHSFGECSLYVTEAGEVAFD